MRGIGARTDRHSFSLSERKLDWNKTHTSDWVCAIVATEWFCAIWLSEYQLMTAWKSVYMVDDRLATKCVQLKCVVCFGFRRRVGTRRM